MRTTLGTAAALLAACVSASAQGGARAVPVDLVTPVYPPIAQSARVSGEVTVVVTVRPDGSIATTELVAGTPLLNEAATTAALASRFECRDCGATPASHTITYSFQLGVPPHPPEPGSPSASRVYTVAESPRVHALVYTYRVRSGRCAWMWKCGWRR